MISESPTWSETTFCTPEVARETRKTYAYPRQRKINDENIIRLATEMEAGRFVQGTQVFIAVLPDGTRYLLNSNHTLEAVDLSGVGQWLTFTFLRVTGEEAAGFTYAVLDTQKIRTWIDALRASGKNEDLPFPNQTLAALGIIAGDFSLSRTNRATRLLNKSRHARLSLIDHYKDAAHVINGAIMGGESARTVRRAAVLAVALVTAKHQPSSAAEFWGRLAQDEGLVKGEPEKALLTYLRNNPVAAPANRIPHQCAAAAAWNAYFEGRQIMMVKPQQMVQFRLLGTPWFDARRTTQAERFAVSTAGEHLAVVA